jgi:hypothetical protein
MAQEAQEAFPGRRGFGGVQMKISMAKDGC